VKGGGGRILSIVALLAAGGTAGADEPECRTGSEKEYIVWNFDRLTSTLFGPTEIEDELKKINREALLNLGTDDAPAVKVSACRNAALLDKLISVHEPADLGDFVLVVLSANAKDFEVHIVPYIVNRDRPRLITHSECTKGGPVPSVNAYRLEISTYAYAALALSEIRRLESLHELCRVRHAQFFLERALSALATFTVTTAPDQSAAAMLQRHLEEKRAWLKPMMEAAANTASRCGMSPESSHLSLLLK
jgi:hypothetical protein